MDLAELTNAMMFSTFKDVIMYGFERCESDIQ